jgi:hypothetical protein
LRLLVVSIGVGKIHRPVRVSTFTVLRLARRRACEDRKPKTYNGNIKVIEQVGGIENM